MSTTPRQCIEDRLQTLVDKAEYARQHIKAMEEELARELQKERAQLVELDEQVAEFAAWLATHHE